MLMKSMVPTLVLLAAALVLPALAAESDPPHVADCDSTTLRLYFPPGLAADRTTPGEEWQPRVARLFVNDQFVGNAILNSLGHIPVLNLGMGDHQIRIEMDGDKRFESTIHALGRGSRQILFVEFKDVAHFEK